MTEISNLPYPQSVPAPTVQQDPDGLQKIVTILIKKPAHTPLVRVGISRQELRKISVVFCSKLWYL